MLDTGAVGYGSHAPVAGTIQSHRCSVEALIATVSGAAFDLYPLQGLFASEQQGYLAEFHQQQDDAQVDQARLYGRLVLLLQANDLCSSYACTMALGPACRELSIAGVQFGINVRQADGLEWINSADIHGLFSCAVVRYSDTLAHDLCAMQRLATTIRSCRGAGWPLLADYHHPGRV